MEQNTGMKWNEPLTLKRLYCGGCVAYFRVAANEGMEKEDGNGCFGSRV